MSGHALAQGQVSAVRSSDTINWRGVGAFLTISFVVAWLLELPIVLTPHGLLSPWA